VNKGVEKMEKRFSEMTEYELKAEIARLRERARRAEQMGIINEYAVYERKATVAEAFLLDPKDYVPGEIYRIKNETESYFYIDYLKGVFAWGFRLGGDKRLEALPISMLEKIQ